MHESMIERVQNNPKFHALVATRSKFSWMLTFAMLAIYYGFILLIAFSPATLGTPISNGVTTIGIPLGIFVIISAFVLTGIYVRRANTEFDQLTREVVEEAKQ
ncbi:DUF485 domain-containing protein [Chitinibacter sp. SCUT-21]|uniref:DUF485 domain-containing protein n=1 Tax=Chitinibacter sp. SCUT-21 TaxID=2970891 RepID=UPI0035A73A1A